MMKSSVCLCPPGQGDPDQGVQRAGGETSHSGREKSKPYLLISCMTWLSPGNTQAFSIERSSHHRAVKIVFLKN